MSIQDIAAVQSLPAAPAPAENCAAPGCRCTPTVRGAVLCEPHAQQLRATVDGVDEWARADATPAELDATGRAQIHALQAEPAAANGTGPTVTRASLQADLLAARERAVRLNTRIQHLEKRLSEALGDEVWRESGLGAPADIDALNQKIAHLEQQVTDLRQQIEERDEDLAAARAANRELMTRLNTPGSSRRR